MKLYSRTLNAITFTSIFYTFLCGASEICLTEHFENDQTLTPKGYERSPYVDQETWSRASPYFLPEDHPAKAALDKIFSQSRAILDKDSLKKAGFTDIIEGEVSHVIVAKHRKFRGYLVKLYTDDYAGLINEYPLFERRILGAIQLKNSIDSHGYSNYFKVPGKWIYPLPADTSIPDNFMRRNFILVVEEMNILPSKINAVQLGSKFVTKELLYALYTILEENGLLDGAMPQNIPICNDGRIAFLDTEHCNVWPVRYKRLNKYLSKEMAQYWFSLTKQ